MVQGNHKIVGRLLPEGIWEGHIIGLDGQPRFHASSRDELLKRGQEIIDMNQPETNEPKPEYNLPPVSYEVAEQDLLDTVRLAASLRREILDSGFGEMYANEVSKAFLWRSLGLE